MSKKQKIEITATCRSAEEAEKIAREKKNSYGVIDVAVIGIVVKFICEVASELALTTFGRLKDALPWYCRCTCRPINT